MKLSATFTTITLISLWATLKAYPPLAPAHSAPKLSFSAPEKIDIPSSNDQEAPIFADYDSDGITDLLSGIYKGHILFRKNTGTNEKPKYAEPVKIMRGDRAIRLKHC